MKDEMLIGAVALGAIAIYALRKPISDLTTPTGSILQSGADLVQHTVKGAETIQDYSLNAMHELSELPQNLNQFVKSKTTAPKIKTIPLAQQVSVSSKNTIYTNPNSKVVKGLDLTSAQQMIEVAKNPSLQNIATNIKATGTTVYTPIQVKLTPKTNMGGIMI